LTLSAIKALAEEYGVCTHPIALRRTDLSTGLTEVIDLPCGATRERRCVGCARRGKRLRQQQCREGWHRADEPLPPPQADREQVGMLLLRADFEYARADCLAKGDWAQVADLDDGITELEALMTASGMRGHIPPNRTPVPPWAAPANSTPSESIPDASAGIVDLATDPDDGNDTTGGTGGAESAGGRRVRSTRRRQDAPDLPRRTVTPQTVGQTFAGRNGRVFRPSTFLTLTLPSYGRVHDGAPLNPATYDYRQAAWDAVHFPALLDRLWQNLRRAVGWNVQYFGAVEPQRRLAPHAHFAIRGAIPRTSLRTVIAATYRQVWWPSTATVRYPMHAPQPVWDDKRGTYLDPDTRTPLRTWDQALDDLDEELDADPNRGPEHVVGFGPQLDIQGVLGGTPQADKMIGYLTKYLTKSVSDCHRITGPAAEAHQRRLWEELRVTPCSPRCANCLRYGIVPVGARAKMATGYCRAKVHQLDTLGIGGRRVLVSRQWSGKTLRDHRHDQRAWVRNLLAQARGIEDDIDERTAQEIAFAREGGYPAPIAWELARPNDPDVPDLARRLLQAVSTRIRHRAVIAAARAADPPSNVSATGEAVAMHAA
jgi:hypothetical protein